MSAWLKPLAQIHRITGRKIRLGIADEVENIIVKDDKIYVIIRRARISERKNGYDIVQRGIQTVFFNYDPAMGWQRQQLTVWDEAGPPERHVTYAGPTPAEHAERTEWEQMCYRPGTHITPLDNEARKAQGY